MIRFADLERTIPGLVAGITTRSGPLSEGSTRGGDLDFSLSTGGDLPSLSLRYMHLAKGLGFDSVDVVRQVHDSALLSLDRSSRAGFRVAGEADGLIAGHSGRLMVVTVADCVPVFVATCDGSTLGLLHAGWRGAAAGILREGIESVMLESGRSEAELRIYLGPAICGGCYEVGPEVWRRFDDPGDVPGHLDLRHVLAGQAVALGIPSESVVTSTLCTKCESDQFHSHRGLGEKAGRMAAFLGRIA